MKNNAFFNWSGGKDSAYALYKVLGENQFEIDSLLTSISSKYNRISIHGVREELLEQQAQMIGINLRKVYIPDSPSMDDYNRIMKAEVTELTDIGIKHSIFGDIFLEDLRKYREDQLALLDVKAVFPLWKTDTYKLVQDFIDKGFKAIVVSVDGSKLDRSFAGRELDKNFISDLPKNVDPCGENGEYHSFVYDGPIFKKPIRIIKGEVVCKEYQHGTLSSDFWFCDLIPDLDHNCKK